MDLSAVLEQVWAAASVPLAERRRLCRQAVAMALGNPPAPSAGDVSSSSADELEDFSEALRVIQKHVGPEIKHVGDEVRLLRQQATPDAAQLSSRLRKLSTVRNMRAHPDGGFLQDLHGLLNSLGVDQQVSEGTGDGSVQQVSARDCGPSRPRSLERQCLKEPDFITNGESKNIHGEDAQNTEPVDAAMSQEHFQGLDKNQQEPDEFEAKQEVCKPGHDAHSHDGREADFEAARRKARRGKKANKAKEDKLLDSMPTVFNNARLPMDTLDGLRERRRLMLDVFFESSVNDPTINQLATDLENHIVVILEANHGLTRQ